MKSTHHALVGSVLQDSSDDPERGSSELEQELPELVDDAVLFITDHGHLHHPLKPHSNRHSSVVTAPDS